VFLKKVLPPPSRLKSATFGKQFVIEKWVKEDYAGQKQQQELSFGRPKKDKYMLFCTAEVEH
jgi:hypothetical protein